MNTANDKRLFWACFCALVSTAFAFVFRDMIINEWGRQFALTETQKGEILGVGLWPFAVSIIIFSLIVDRVGYKLVMTLAFIFQVVSVIITVSAPLVLAKEGASQEEINRGFEIGYWLLYVGSLVVALGNGMVEAVINPVIATMFADSKTKWLNILHAGWPGGLVLGGLLFIGLSDGGIFQVALGRAIPWEFKVSLILIPTILYFVLMIVCTFPVQERVAAGVSYVEMLKEIGILGAVVVVGLFARQMGTIIAALLPTQDGEPQNLFKFELAFTIITVGVFAFYIRDLGRPIFVFLCIIMIPLAITELGIDSWITPLMENDMKAIGRNAGWVMVYACVIMTVLRFVAGPIVEKLSPLGLLAFCAAIAAAGLAWLSMSQGIMIFAAATFYGIGKTFFWPTMLGVVSEQFPKGGAMTLNVVGGVGMLGVGVIGTPLLGLIQDNFVDKTLASENKALYDSLIDPKEKGSVLGTYKSLDEKKVSRLNLVVSLYETRENLIKADKEKGKVLAEPELEKMLASNLDYLAVVKESYNKLVRKQGDSSEKTFAEMHTGLKEGGFLVDKTQFDKLEKDKQELEKTINDARKRAMLTAAAFPVFMLICYLILIFWYQSQGGYKPVQLAGPGAGPAEAPEA